jgi:hypothetical protein
MLRRMVGKHAADTMSAFAAHQSITRKYMCSVQGASTCFWGADCDILLSFLTRTCARIREIYMREIAIRYMNFIALNVQLARDQ